MTNIEPVAYPNRYTTWTRSDLLEEVRTKVKKSRFEHILRVEEAALLLAKQYGADPEACSIAALLHDYAKDSSRSEIEGLVSDGHIEAVLLDYGSQIWHGPVGAYYAKETFGVEDHEILQAIDQHTIGGEEMSLIGKILFIADYTESGRDFPGVEKARELAKKDLDEACIYKITQTLLHLVQTGKRIYPHTLTVYNAWVSLKGGKTIE